MDQGTQRPAIVSTTSFLWIQAIGGVGFGAVCAAQGHLEGDKLDVNVGLLLAWSYASLVVGLLLAVCAALHKRKPQVRTAALGLQVPQAALGVMEVFIINPALGVMQVLIVLIVLPRLLRSEGRPSAHEGSLQG